jgi:SEC-C motif-containing protein
MLDAEKPCLCGSNTHYSACCQPFHHHEQSPLTAEALMRSRYSGYAMRNTAYLLETWDKSTCPTDIDFSKEEVTWTKLEIISVKKGREKDKKGIVEFKAYYTSEAEEYVLNELSRFIKVSGRWVYMDGVVKSSSKVGLKTNQGKNAPCACGSGKKFKRCCGQ